MKFHELKIALVTDWLTNIGGGERVLKAISDLFPGAPIYTTVCNREKIGDFNTRDIRTSYLQKIPYFNKKHQILLPFLPRAIESLDLSDFDIVLSFSSSVAKSVLTHPHQLHVCYIHSPMRYAWEPQFDARFARIPKILSPLVHSMLHHLRIWDKVTALRPDYYISNSKTTQERVRQYYRTDSSTLYPPVALERFFLSHKKKDYYLAMGRMVPYKKFDLIVNTFIELPEKKLVLIGNGSELKHLKEKAKLAKNITFLENVSDAETPQWLSEAKGFILPQKEDAGIVQLEALASGTPVIAFKAGGALEVIQDKINGVFFQEQHTESLKKAIHTFETLSFFSEDTRNTALPFSTQAFQEAFLQKIERFYKEKFELGSN